MSLLLRLGMASRLLLAFAALIVPLAVFSVWSYQRTLDDRRDDALTDQVQLTRTFATMLDAGAQAIGDFGDPLADLQRGGGSTLRIVFVGVWCAEGCHHLVADEFVDGAAVSVHDRNHLFETLVRDLAHLLRVESLGEGGEAGDVGEKNRHHPPLGAPADRLRPSEAAVEACRFVVRPIDAAAGANHRCT